MSTETELRLGKAELAAMRGAQRAHDRQFTRAARAGRMDEVEELEAESDGRWQRYEAMCDELLRARP